MTSSFVGRPQIALQWGSMHFDLFDEVRLWYFRAVSRGPECP
jgi:hypothetical protein